MTPSSTIYGYPSKLVIDVHGQEVVLTNWLLEVDINDLGKVNQTAVLDAIQVAEKNAHARRECCCCCRGWRDHVR